MKRIKNNGVNRRASLNKAPDSVVGRLPPLATSIQTSHRFRYTATSTFNGTITDLDLFYALVSAASATAAHSLFSGVKLARVALFGAPDVTGSEGTTVSVEFLGSSSGGPSAPARLFSDTVLGTAGLAKVAVRPPKQSYAGMWLGVSGEAVMALAMPTGSVIDIDLTVVLSNGTQTAGTATVAGATGGAIYSLALDFSGSGLLVPVSYATVAS